MRRRPERPAFTLVELLVVVAIIALLVSILVPALQKAQARARLIVCASDQRSIALAIYLYADDNSNAFPPSFPESSTVWGIARQTDPAMPGYHFMTSNGGPYPDGTNYFKCWMDLVHPYLNNVIDVWRCPSYEKRSVTGFGMAECTYGYNGYFGYFTDMKMDEIIYPSRLIMTLDYNTPYGSYANFSDFRSFITNLVGWAPDPCGMHGDDLMEVAFVDGHVEEVNRLDPEYFDDWLTHWVPRIYWHHQSPL